jgi:hypothetical protein
MLGFLVPKGAIMRPETYCRSQLVECFARHKVLTVESIGRLLGNPSKRTILRKLKALACRASYSHAGKYYTRDEHADFDRDGLWSFQGIHFSRQGTLIDTIVYLVCHSAQGLFAAELRSLLHVRVHNTLADLYASKRLVREQIGSEYLYLCPTTKAEQADRRRQSIQSQLAPTRATDPIEAMPTPLAENLRFLASVLNEQHRRLYLGLESLRLGHGGDRRIAQLSGVDVKTIARGRRELEARDVTPERIRRAGAGRPALKKTPK